MSNSLSPAVPARTTTAGCWNRIGVRGDSSCPELARYIHCRNCPVYSATAADQLDIERSAEDLAHATRRVAREKTVAAPHTQSVVVFRIGAEWLALPTAIIREIVGPQPIHALPHRRDGVVLGLANIRGQLLVCAALRQILQLDASPPQERTKHPADARMLVTLQGGACTVYPVDEVYGVQRFPPQDLVAVPKAAATHIKAVLTWQAKSVSLLDEELLLSTVNRSLALATAI
jgi:chemotaxis-related protein WspD